MINPKKVLFICTGNSCRSQIAEGLLKKMGNRKFEVFSAGSKPSKLNPHAIQVMKEVDIDISNQSSENINKYLNTGINILITVCDNAQKSCPTFSEDVIKLHWSVKDPFISWDYDPSQLATFRITREKIKDKIIHFLKTMES
jgi:arsenate reductase|tara:strand:+ start:3706 stop:4131 length:426 start_codon:yes stop_codon:yes gene_type:complete